MTIPKHIERAIENEATVGACPPPRRETGVHVADQTSIRRNEIDTFKKAARFGYELAQEEVRELVEAMQFYAQDCHWFPSEYYGVHARIDSSDWTGHPSDPIDKRFAGARAREALRKYEEGRK